MRVEYEIAASGTVAAGKGGGDGAAGEGNGGGIASLTCPPDYTGSLRPNIRILAQREGEGEGEGKT